MKDVSKLVNTLGLGIWIVLVLLHNMGCCSGPLFESSDHLIFDFIPFYLIICIFTSFYFVHIYFVTVGGAAVHIFAIILLLTSPQNLGASIKSWLVFTFYGSLWIAMYLERIKKMNANTNPTNFTPQSDSK